MFFCYKKHFRFIYMEKEKLINSMLFVLNNLEERKSDLHKLFKILYFADQKHLVSYGFPITGDFYIAMPAGPVPSQSYDMLKAIRGDSFWSNEVANYKQLFGIEKQYIVTAKTPVDIDEFAESEVTCLTQSIEENKYLTFQQLKDKSHKIAWENARNDEYNFDNKINMLDIAKEADANTEILKYIQWNIENQKLSNTYAEIR